MAAAPVSTLVSARSRGLMRAWQAAAIGGVALLAVHALFRGSVGLDDFFNRYWYNALILLALAAAVVRAVTTRSERAPWIAFAVGIGCWAVAEILFDFGPGTGGDDDITIETFFEANFAQGGHCLLRGKLDQHASLASIVNGTYACTYEVGPTPVAGTFEITGIESGAGGFFGRYVGHEGGPSCTHTGRIGGVRQGHE